MFNLFQKTLDLEADWYFETLDAPYIHVPLKPCLVVIGQFVP